MKKPHPISLAGFSYCILLFLYLPLFILILYSFNSSRMNAIWTGWTFDWYLSLFQNQRIIEAFFNSIIIASGTAVFSTFLGCLLSVSFYRYSYRWQSGWTAFVHLPLVLPDILMGLSLLLFFNYLSIPTGKVTILIAHITFSIPFVFLLVSTRLQEISPHLDEAAQDLGATPLQSFYYITLPMLYPSIFSSLLLVFSLSLDDFVISSFVSGPGSTTLPIYIYGMVKRGVTPEVNALATLLVVITFVFSITALKIGKIGKQKHIV